MTGDSNVPAQKVTLFTLDTPPTVGRYQGYEQDSDGNTLPARPMGATSRLLPCVSMSSTRRTQSLGLPLKLRTFSESTKASGPWGVKDCQPEAQGHDIVRCMHVGATLPPCQRVTGIADIA